MLRNAAAAVTATAVMRVDRFVVEGEVIAHGYSRPLNFSYPLIIGASPLALTPPRMNSRHVSSCSKMLASMPLAMLAKSLLFLSFSLQSPEYAYRSNFGVKAQFHERYIECQLGRCFSLASFASQAEIQKHCDHSHDEKPLSDRARCRGESVRGEQGLTINAFITLQPCRVNSYPAK